MKRENRDSGTSSATALSSSTERRNLGLNHEQRVLAMALLAGFPGSVVALVLLWSGVYSGSVRWTLTVLILLVWLGVSYSLKDRVVRPLQTISNLLAALREGDYSIRARGESYTDALGGVMLELNTLGETLRIQRLEVLEATALLRTVMAEINVAVFAFDYEDRLQLVNRAGERLLERPAERLLGRRAAELGLAECLEFEPDSRDIRQMIFPSGAGQWGVRRSSFRVGGLPHRLLVLADLSHVLREEERNAWQRLVRVLGHELNNSLAPIKSIAGSLNMLLAREPRAPDWQDDMQRGLEVISSRAEALSRFMESYSRLARLPPPQLRPVEISALVRRVVELETRLHVAISESPEVTIQADSDQLEQLLINLLRNAVDAALETGGGVEIGWTKNGDNLEVIIEDEGPGLANTSNLFVPFFTTKRGGSGIGLVLSRQIAEAHGGTLVLVNRRTGHGCQARLSLPRSVLKSLT